VLVGCVVQVPLAGPGASPTAPAEPSAIATPTPSPTEGTDVTNQPVDDDFSALTAYGLSHADQFGGLFWDNEAGHVVLLFTTDLDRHAAAIRDLHHGADAEVRKCTYTQAELQAVQADLDFKTLKAEGIEMMDAGIDVVQNVVLIGAKSDRADAKSFLENRYGGKLIATIYPLPGAWSNLLTGDGWRLLAVIESNGRWAYTVHAATTASEFDDLWSQLSTDADQPSIDYSSEIALFFGEAIGSSCKELRLDGVVIDLTRRLVVDQVSDPLAPRVCTADLYGAQVFIVALERAKLPQMPFTAQIENPPPCCLDTARMTVSQQ
jgi:hypothetical protein